MKKNIAVLTMVVFLAVACKPVQEPQVVNAEAEKTALSSVCDQFLNSFNSKDAEVMAAFLTEGALVCGTDPSEFWNKKEITESWRQSMADTNLVFNIKVDKRDIRLAADGFSAIVTEQYYISVISEKIMCRNSMYAVKAGTDWKFDYVSWSLIPKNEDIAKLNEALK